MRHNKIKLKYVEREGENETAREEGERGAEAKIVQVKVYPAMD